MREGLAGLGPDDDLDRARVTAALASALVLAPGDEALAIAEEAERIARELSDDEARSGALSGWAWALRSRGRAAELCRIASAGVEHSLAVDRPEWEFTARYLLGEGLIESCQLDSAEIEMDQAGAFPSVLKGWAPVVFAASRAIAAGRLDEAEELIERAAPLGAALGETNDVIVWTQKLSVALARARYDDARAWMDRLDKTVFGLAGGWRMLMLAEAGDLEAAVAAHATWVRDIRPLVPQVIMPWTLEAETAVAYRVGDTMLAARLRDDVAPYAGHMLGGDTGLLGTGDYLIGRVAFVEGCYDDAIAATTRAIEIAHRWGFDRLTTNHRIDLARALEARGGPGDGDLARAALTDALATADRLGLVAAASEARTLLD
jgi:tetratricopeptide (TPR) repeat protein